MPTEARLAQLEARLAALQHIDGIESLKHRYWRAIDRQDPATVAACLTEDVIVDFDSLPRCETREAFMRIIRQAATQPHIYGMHHGQNPTITLTGAHTAQGLWEVFYYGIDASSGTLTQLAGAYTDTYRRENGAWLIATTAMRITSLHVQHATPGHAPVTAMFGRAA
jgi:ketosteroid isomerase-like protein